VIIYIKNILGEDLLINNNKRKKFYYDKNMKRDEIVSEIVTFFSIIMTFVAFFNSFCDTVTTLFVITIVCILVLPYVGVKIDLIRGYE